MKLVAKLVALLVADLLICLHLWMQHFPNCTSIAMLV